MKKLLLILCVCGMAVTVMAGVLSPYHLGRVTVRVVDEQRIPVTNATVGIGFSKNIPAGEGWGTRPFSITGQTDTNGMFSAEAEGNPSGSCSARKEGYYPTLGVDFMFTNVVGDRWEPWNPTLEIVLRKIGKPMPMFAKRVEAFIPLMNEPVGFDLEKGDWVVPYGKGDVKDFTFLFRGRFASARDRDEALQITFSGPKDGIQGMSASPSHGSQLRLPPEAPEHGYTNLWVREKTMHPGTPRQNQKVRLDQNYFVRVRSVVDEQGKLKEAKYGKLYGDFDFGYAESNKVLLTFTYYLNPDGTRNLEFDPAKNLFTDLSSREQVHEP